MCIRDHSFNTYAKFPADLVTFIEEILNGKLNFLCSGNRKPFLMSLFPFVVLLLLFFSTFNNHAKTLNFHSSLPLSYVFQKRCPGLVH